MMPPSWVNRSTPVAVGFGNDTDGAAVVDDDDGAVSALGQQVQASPTVPVGAIVSGVS